MVPRWQVRDHDALGDLLRAGARQRVAQELRVSVVAKAQRSTRAMAKARDKATQDGRPVHSFQTLLADLATIVKNRVQPKEPGLPAFDMTTTPTPLQAEALDLLKVRL